MDKDIIAPFISSTVNVIQTMTGLSPVAGAATERTNLGTWGEVSGMIGMAGDKLTGNMVLSFDDKSILTIVSKMFMEEMKEINSDVVDAVGEMTNVICGHVKRELGVKGLQFNMATPCMIRGRNVQLSTQNGGSTVVVPFSIGNGQFVLEISLAPANNGVKPH